MIEFKSGPFYKWTWKAAQVRRMLGIKWYQFEHRFSELSEDDLLTARQFYYRLSYLTDDERTFLKRHYYSPRTLLTDVPTDSEMAVRWNMTYKAYREKRTAIERKLRCYQPAPKTKGSISREEVLRRIKIMYGDLIDM